MHSKLHFHDPGQSIDSSPQISITAGYVNRATAIEIVQHSFMIRSTVSTVAQSALLWMSTAMLPLRTVTAARGSIATGEIGVTSANCVSCWAFAIANNCFCHL